MARRGNGVVSRASCAGRRTFARRSRVCGTNFMGRADAFWGLVLGEFRAHSCRMRGEVCHCRYCTERVQIKCAFCRRLVLVLRKKVEQRGQRFCSRRCANRWNGRTRAGRPPCACGCGTLIGRQATRYISGHNPSKPPEPRSGPDNWRWSGGPKRPHLSPEHREWREKVFRRDNFTCRGCGARSGVGKAVYLHAHHIRHVADDPSAAYDIDNGLTLCIDCHRTLHWGADRKQRTKRAGDSAAE